MSEGHVIIGTAGHVDHGKTELIRALTGKETDRLREEKERGISIALGFAPFMLPSGRIAGVVDVPGHERFINNMLAGISGIDLVLLVVDVTEGVMAQTKEHLDILQLLNISKGIIVLTKVDLAESEDWLDLVEEEVKEALAGSFLSNAPVYRVSSLTGSGIQVLKQGIDSMATSITGRDIQAPLRLPVDRGFIISGFGTVVTGTLITGEIHTGDIVEIMPPGVKSRVRRIQVHNETVTSAGAGQRVALNLPGLEKEKVERGSVVALPGYFSLTNLLDCELSLLSSAKRPIKNLTRIHFYLGTARVVGRVVLLDREQLEPGDTGLVQIRLEASLVAQAGDRFIIRSFSPITTIGGGRVLDHHPIKHKRMREDIIKQLQSLASEREPYLVLQRLKDKGPLTLDELVKRTRLGKDTVAETLTAMRKQGRIDELSGTYLTSEDIEYLQEQIKETLQNYHTVNFLSPGLSRAEMQEKLKFRLADKPYQALLDLLTKKEMIMQKKDIIFLYDFEPIPDEKQQRVIDKIEQLFLQKGFSPPTCKETEEKSGLKAQQLEQVISFLLDKGRLVKTTEDILFHRNTVDEGIRLLKEHFRNNDFLSLAYYRDLVKSSRKYVQALLEYYDSIKLTRRQGDDRVPWKLYEKDDE